MYLRSRLLFAGLILCFNFLFSQSQTLYWVGGSGNFNDPSHWSLSPGGRSANITPGLNSDVVFDNYSGPASYEVLMNEKCIVRSFAAYQDLDELHFTGKSGELIVGGNFYLSPFTKFDYSGLVNFSSTSASQRRILFNVATLQADLIFGKGNFLIESISQAEGASVTFQGGNYQFRRTSLRSDYLTIKGSDSRFDLDTSYFFINKRLAIPDLSTFETSKFSLYAPYHIEGAVNINPQVNFGTSSKLSGSSINSVCQASVYAFPACSGSCSGVFSVVIDPACIDIPFVIDVSNGNCTSTANTLTTSTNNYTFVVNNVCYCPGASFNLLMYDANFLTIPFVIYAGQVASASNFNFTPPSFGLSSIGSGKAPSCAASCDGTVALNLSGGSPPYTITVSGPINQTITTLAGFTHTNLCAGSYTYNFVDKYNCSGLAIRTVSAPAVLNTGVITKSVSCFGQANGAFSISPTGGTANYTINFNPGGTFTSSAGGTRAITGLSPGPISATVTDSKGCTAVASTVISQPTDFSISGSHADINCGGSCSGVASVTVTGVSGGAGAGSYSYSWAPGGGTASSNNTLCAGPATVFITDNILGCSTQTVFNILQIPQMAMSSSVVTNVVCNSSLTGAFNGTLTGGTPNYTVTLVNSGGATLQTVGTTTQVALAGLGADNYSLFVRDAIPCFTVFTFSVTQPSSVSLSAVTQSNTCPGGTTGSATLTGSGGNGPAYTFTVAGAATGSVVTNLATNTYTAITKDVTGCVSAPITFSIIEPPVFAFNYTATALNCYNTNTGSVVSVPSLGTGPYTFTLTSALGSTANSTGTFVNLPGSQGPLGVGNYTLSVGDAFFPGSCAQSTVFTVNQPTSSPTSTIAKLDPTCFGSCNGTLTGSASGGTSGYTFNWITPTTNINNSQFINGQCQGNYTLNVVDANGCLAAPVTMSLVSPTQVTLSINTTSISCSGTQGPNANGAINTTVTGGNAPYTYTWTGPGAFSSNAANISSLAGGTYTLDYSANGCAQTQTTQVVNTATAMVLTNTITSTSCASLCDGTVRASVTGGRSPYNYQFTGSSPFTNGTGVFNNVCNNFTVVVTDANSCTTSITSSVTTPPLYSITTATTNITCFGLCNGSFTTTPSGGLAPYSYTLQGPSSTATAAGNSGVFGGLCANNYTLFVQDNSVPATCSQTFAVNITQPASLQANFTPISASCFTVCDGAFTSTVTGGSGSYSYTYASVSNTATVANPTGLCANPYTITVRDNVGGCTIVTNSTITEPTQITLSSSVVTNVTCNGGNNGAIAITPTGGPVTSYSYSWSPGSFTTSTISNLTAGIYNATVISGACSRVFTFNVSAPVAMGLTANTTSLLCRNVCNGSATLNVTGGTAPYTYSLAGIGSNGTGVFSGLCASTLSASVTDSFGCQATTNTVLAQPASSVVITAIATRSSCATCSGGATVTASGGTGAMTYVWTNSLGVIPAVSTSTIGGLCPSSGTPASLYTVTAVDANTCTASQTFSVPQVIILVSATSGSVSCAGNSDGTATVSATGGVPAYSFTWSPATASAVTGATTSASSLSASVLYSVQVRDNSSPVNCVTSQTLQIQPVNAISVTAVSFSPSCFATTDGSINITPSGGPSATYQFTWTSTNSYSSNTQNASSVPSGTYFLTVKSGTACTSSYTFALNSPSLITNSFAVTQPSNCSTPNTGSIVATPGGGNGTYSLSWSPGGATSATITNLVPQGYTLTVNSGSCVQTFPTAIQPPVTPTIGLASSASVACNSASTGVASFTTTGSPAFTFTWTPATPSVVTGSTTTANSLVAGTYSVRVTDGNNCVSNIATVNIQEPPPLSFTSNITPVICPSGSTGVISLTVSQGTLASNSFTYNWSNGASTNGSVSTVSNLTATPVSGSTYTASVVNASGCSSSTTILVPGPNNFSFTASTASLNCFGIPTGSIGLSVTPTTGVTYSWSTVPSGTFSANTPTITNLFAATYSVKVSNAGGCVATGINTFQIAEPAQMTGTATINHNVTCNPGLNNGSATFSVSGGTGAYTYSWSPGGYTTAAVLGSLSAQPYTITATDALGCTKTVVATISGPAPFTATLTPTSPVCATGTNGSISTLISGNQGNVTYNWAPAGTGQNPTGLDAGTGIKVYTLTATDDSLCVLTRTVSLSDPPALGTSLTFTNPVCFGNCNGAAVATVTNAVGTPTVVWTINSPTSTSTFTGTSITGLCSPPVAYSVTVSDANGCTNTNTFSMSTPAQIVTNYTSSPSLCGPGQGSIVAQATGGTGTLAYTWSGSLPAGTVQVGLQASVYTLTVTDANNCTNTTAIAVNSINGPTATLSSGTLSCYGYSTNLVLAGLSAGATFTWMAPLNPSVTSQTYSNVPAGTYSVQLSDINNCLNFYGVTISQPSSVSIVTSSVAPTCFGICDGSISVVASGGTPGYTYTWSGASTGTTSSLNNLCGGDLTLTVTDANNCPNNYNLGIPVLSSITINQFVTNNTCYGSCNGSATIQVVSTTTTSTVSTVSWGNGQFGLTAANLCGGTQSVTVTDTRGCYNIFGINIGEPTDVTVTPVVTQPKCGECNGSLTITASGGTGPNYNFNWSTGATTTTLTDLCAGPYQVQVTDNANCIFTKNVIINNSNGITGETVTETDENCTAACDGAATVIATGGASPYTYNWILPNLSITTNTAAGLCPGVYFVQMRDANNCLRTASVNIGSADSLIIHTFITPPNCTVTPPNGTVVAAVENNKGAVSYSWAPGTSTTAVLANVGPGSYTLTVFDAGAGCTRTTIVNISNLESPTVSAVQQDIDCLHPKGSVTLTPAGNSPFTFTWSSTSSAATSGTLNAGITTATVTDGGGCRWVGSFTIEAEPALELIASAGSVRCFNGKDGTIQLLALEGKLPLTYSLILPAGTTTPAAFQNYSLSPGTYTAIVRDNKGCLDSTTINLINPVAVTSSVNSTNASCSTLADGSATAQATGGKPSYSYTWTATNIIATGQTLTAVLPGIYSLTATDSLGCFSAVQMVTIVPTVTVIANAGPDFSVCPGTELVLTGTNSIGAVNYKWLATPNGNVLSNSSSLNVTGVETATYQLQTTSSVAGCVDVDSMVVNVYPKPYLDAGPSYTMPIYSSTVIGGSPTSLAGGPSHTWAPAQYLDDPFIQNPVASNTLNVTFTVSINYGDNCLVSDTVQLLIIPEIKVNSGFSPNADGKNDLWIIDYIDQFPENTVEIYNRWGEQLFYSKGYFVPWDGTYKGQPVPVGTYYYVIRLNHFAYTKPYTGPVTVFR